MPTGLEVFDPSIALDPTAFVGEAGAHRLLEAATHFPGGPIVLVFALFWSPVGPGIPAGVLLARHIPLHPVLTFGLYALSDVLSAFVFGPLFALARDHGRKVDAIHRFGRRALALATIGVRVPRAEEVRAGGRIAPTLFRIATVGFGVDVYTGGILATSLPVPRGIAWICAIAGDLVWFALLLGASMGAAWLVDDERVVAVVVIAAMIVIPWVARRLFPALRDPRS